MRQAILLLILGFCASVAQAQQTSNAAGTAEVAPLPLPAPTPLPGLDALMPAKQTPPVQQAAAAAPAKAAPPAPAATPATPAPTSVQGTTSNVTVPEGALDVTADGTLEWLRQQQVYVARGNASATRNDTTIKADILTAHYTVPEGKKDGVEIKQVTADGNVHLISPTAEAWGDHGVYDLDKHVVVLTGNALKLVTTDEVVTARDSLEYFEDSSTGVARGNAVAIRGEDKLTADVIAAKFVKTDSTADAANNPGGAPASPTGKTALSSPKPPQTQAVDKDAAPSDVGNTGDTGEKKQKLERLDAKGHVVLVTITDVVTGDEGVYSPITDEATVTGTVKVTRGDSQLDGARAEVDMATGISRVYSAPGTRVRGLFVPQKKDKAANATASATNASSDSDAKDATP